MKFPLRTVGLMAFLFLFTAPVQSQFLKKLGKKAKEAAERTVERRVESETSKKTDQTLDSILEPGSKKSEPKSLPQPTNQDDDTLDTGTKDGNASKNTSISNSDQEPSLEVYSKFDFVPGDTPLFFDDFSNDFIGDFPAKWNTDGGGEVVKVNNNNQNWFEMLSGSYYIPDVPYLPEEYTIEFDLLAVGVDKNTSSAALLHVILDEKDNFSYSNNTVFSYLPFCQYTDIDIRMWNNIDGKNTINNRINADVREEMNQMPHISIAVNKQRFRLWINEEKHVDIPRIVPVGKITKLKFEPVGFKDGKEKLLISNLKVAEGGLDLRRKLISEGKISTNGILFDSGSANIKPESMGIIRQIYQVLQQDSSIKLKIVGHTDADGDDATNLKLSDTRAQSVKKALTDVYGVAANRLTTEGKGELEPIADNTSIEGKTQNRRVEFIKL
ncbi:MULTISPECIES: OmpA family protein [Flavobacteriaceae]|uniref:OmpA family protein n=1 Tax=Flavobacteriaceae TaxID=49546 RepID=UPI0010AE4F77|nr:MULTISPECIES: OmpA family protein [Flavobacteriaceae]NJB37883.1 OmpA family protein [Croceivirga sp. JEA036]TKD60465.1 OmpA family protein [Flavobacterium sp. ASW18X]